MNEVSGFLDSNILVYAFSKDARAIIAQELLEDGHAISVQSLNEFASIERRKLYMSWDEVREALALIRSVCRAVLPVDLAVHERGIELADRYGFALYDAMLVAAALRGACSVFWSEDMHHGLVVEGRLRIVNPFATPA